MLYSGHFGRYDYGTQGNMQHYNATNPPSFDLSHVTIPIGLFWGQNDYLADPTVSVSKFYTHIFFEQNKIYDGAFFFLQKSVYLDLKIFFLPY